MRSILLLALAFVFPGAARAARAADAPECAGCDAYVELADGASQELLAILPTIDAIPLAGGVVHWRPDAGYTTLRVVTDPAYAQANGLSSFDVAAAVLRLVRAHRGWDVTWISARYEPRPSTHNVGSIGHGP